MTPLGRGMVEKFVGDWASARVKAGSFLPHSFERSSSR
jgi:hypothetical protein